MRKNKYPPTATRLKPNVYALQAHPWGKRSKPIVESKGLLGNRDSYQIRLRQEMNACTGPDNLIGHVLSGAFEGPRHPTHRKRQSEYSGITIFPDTLKIGGKIDG